MATTRRSPHNACCPSQQASTRTGAPTGGRTSGLESAATRPHALHRARRLRVHRIRRTAPRQHPHQLNRPVAAHGRPLRSGRIKHRVMPCVQGAAKPHHAVATSEDRVGMTDIRYPDVASARQGARGEKFFAPGADSADEAKVAGTFRSDYSYPGCRPGTGSANSPASSPLPY